LGNLAAVRDLSPQLEKAGFNILLLDIHAAPARDMLDYFEFTSTPTFIIYNARQEVIYRASRLPQIETLLSFSE
jgi:uncharacterized UPF0146 family protein